MTAKKSDLYAILRDVLQALSLQEEDVDRVMKEVKQLSKARSPTPNADDTPPVAGTSGKNSISRLSKHKTLHNKQLSPRDRRREILHNSAIQYLNNHFFLASMLLIYVC